MEGYYGHVAVPLYHIALVTSVADLTSCSVLQQAGVVSPSQGDVKQEQFLSLDVVNLVEA